MVSCRVSKEVTAHPAHTAVSPSTHQTKAPFPLPKVVLHRTVADKCHRNKVAVMVNLRARRNKVPVHFRLSRACLPTAADKCRLSKAAIPHLARMEDHRRLETFRPNKAATPRLARMVAAMVHCPATKVKAATPRRVHMVADLATSQAVKMDTRAARADTPVRVARTRAMVVTQLPATKVTGHHSPRTMAFKPPVKQRLPATALLQSMPKPHRCQVSMRPPTRLISARTSDLLSAAISGIVSVR